MHRTGRSVLITALALVASACAGSDAPETSARGSATSPTAASPGIVDFEGARSLPPGRYRSYEGFTPRFELRLDLRWEADHSLTEFFDFHRDGLTVAFASPERVASLEGLDPVDGDMTAVAFMRSMLSHPGIDGERAGSVPVDGSEVTLYDVRADDRVGMFGGPEGEFSAVGSDRYRLGALRVGDAMLVLMSFTKDESPDAFRRAERVWETISLLDG